MPGSRIASASLVVHLWSVSDDHASGALARAGRAVAPMLERSHARGRTRTSARPNLPSLPADRTGPI
jgi:hypothetical protein